MAGIAISWKINVEVLTMALRVFTRVTVQMVLRMSEKSVLEAPVLAPQNRSSWQSTL